VTAIAKGWARPGDTVLDVGANIGIVSIALAKLVGLSGKVHSFEPNPVLCERISESVRRNRLLNVQLHRFALGSKEDKLQLHVPRSNAGMGSLAWEKPGSDFDRYDVPVYRLDEVLGFSTSIRFMKIDVEGFEAPVLEGARALMQTAPPDAILFEIFDRPDLTPANERTVQLLTEFGYYFFTIDKTLLRLKLRSLDPSLRQKLKSHDVLAVHRAASDLPREVARAAQVTPRAEMAAPGQ
jgi:FkbM family methyltransferase